jgi:hypothetical protein
MINIENLERLNRLRESGALTEEEFYQEKLKLISGKSHDAQKQTFKIALLLGTIVVGVAALAAFLWQNQGKGDEILKPETAAIGPSKGTPSLEMPAKKEDEILKPETAAIGTPKGIPSIETPVTKEDKILKPETAAIGLPKVTPSLRAPATNDVSTLKKAETALLMFATSTEVLGLNLGFLERRLGVPKEKRAGNIVFEVGGCTISYEIDESSVSSLDVNVSQNCQPTIQGMKVTPQTTYGQVFNRQGGGAYLASCLTGCGNAADPTIDLTYASSRATEFISVNYATDYNQVSRALDLWENAVRRQRGLGEFDTPDDYEAFSDVSNPPLEVIPLLRKLRVKSVRLAKE